MFLYRLNAVTTLFSAGELVFGLETFVYVHEVLCKQIGYRFLFIGFFNLLSDILTFLFSTLNIYSLLLL